MENLKLSPLAKMAFNKFLAKNEIELKKLIQETVYSEIKKPGPGVDFDGMAKSGRASDRIINNLRNA